MHVGRVVVAGLLGCLVGCGGRVNAGTAAGSLPAPVGGNAPTDGTEALCVPATEPSQDPLYLLKSFLIDPTGSDPGWNIRAEVTSTMPMSAVSGVTWTGQGRFAITSDKIQFLMALQPMGAQILDAWEVDNVDVSPGEACSTSQAQDWQTSTWVGWHFAKQDPSDMGLLLATGGSSSSTVGSALPLMQCVGMSSSTQATLVPGSFAVDPAGNTMSWRTSVTTVPGCPGLLPAQMTLDLAFAFARP